MPCAQKTDSVHLGMEHAGAESGRINFSRPSSNPYIAKAEISEMGSYGFFPPIGDIVQPGTSVPVIGIVEISLLQYFSKVQCNGSA